MNARLTKGRHIVEGNDATGAYRYEFDIETGAVTGVWSAPKSNRCDHLGDLLRHRNLPVGCCGDVTVEIWQCRVLGECTVGYDVGIPCCASCDKKEV